MYCIIYVGISSVHENISYQLNNDACEIVKEATEFILFNVNACFSHIIVTGQLRLSGASIVTREYTAVLNTW